MSDIRDGAIEAVAEALEDDCNAEAALDVLLDYLEANADEWWEVAKINPRFKDGGPTMERRLLSVLREGV